MNFERERERERERESERENIYYKVASVVEIDEELEISDIQLQEEDDEIEINFEEEKIESCLDSEIDFLDSLPKLVFIDKGSIKM